MQAKGNLTSAPTRIPVPPGTVVKRKRGGTLIADLTHPGHPLAYSACLLPSVKQNSAEACIGVCAFSKLPVTYVLWHRTIRNEVICRGVSGGS